MAASQGATLRDTFKKELFGKEVEEWLGRATPAERERFERVFESIRSIAEAKKAPEAHSQFVQATMEKLKHRGSSAGTPGATSTSGRTTPLGPGSGGGAGWSYTATRAARRTNHPARQQQGAFTEQPRSPNPEADAERPQSAPGEGAGAGADRGAALALAQAAAARRRAISMGHSSTSSPGGAASPEPFSSPVATGRMAGQTSTSGRGTGFVPIPSHATNYQESYTLRSCYPGVYDKALEDTKIATEPNKTFISEWGDSLKVGAEECAKMYMRSTYSAVNDEVVKLRTDAEAIREREFFKWMLRQKSFYGDLLSKAGGADLEALMAVASDEQKREILEALRGAHAVADPCFDRTRSHSQGVHCEMRRLEEAKPLSRLQMNTKLRIMGALHAVSQNQQRGSVSGGGSMRRPATATPITLTLEEGADGAVGAGGSAGGDRALRPTAAPRRPATAGGALMTRASSAPRRSQSHGEKLDMFRSKAPLTWPSGQVGPSLSTYVETFGGAKIGAGHVRPNSALWKVEPIKPVDASVPYGAVNPHTAAAPLRGAYPVPEGMLAPGTASFPQPKGDTTYRSEFAPRDEADLAAQMRAANALAENGRKALQRSTIPMGPRTGVNLIPSALWASETQESFVQHDVDHREPYARAAAMRAMFSGPTASTGKVAGAR